MPTKKRGHTSWSKADTAIVVKFFMTNIKSGVLPGLRQIKPFLDQHPLIAQEKGHWTKIRNKVMNETQAYEKRRINLGM